MTAAEHPEFTERLDAALSYIREEAIKAASIYPHFNSDHEGYAVLLEELDEAWDEIKRNNNACATVEMVQVGAMAVRFLVDLGNLEYLKTRKSLKEFLR